MRASTYHRLLPRALGSNTTKPALMSSAVSTCCRVGMVVRVAPDEVRIHICTVSPTRASVGKLTRNRGVLSAVSPSLLK